MNLPIGEYAKHRGCDPAAVLYAIQDGRIRREADGTIDVEAADRAWQENTNLEKSRPGPKPHDRATEAVPGISYADARALKETYQAECNRLDLEERKGLLVRRDEVERETFNQFRTLRDSCMNLPARLANQLATERDADRVHQVLEDALREVFEQFAEGRTQ